MSVTEAILLGALSTSEPGMSRTVRQLSDELGLASGTVRRVLHRLALAGLVVSTVHNPARWTATDRGRRVANEPVYRPFLRP
ncbi:MarR family transcriptional regulator [Nocardia terrae]